MNTREAFVGLVTGEPTAFLAQYGKIWKDLSDRVAALWGQTDIISKLKALVATLTVAILFIASMLLFVWILLPLLIFGAFLKVIRTSMDRPPRNN